MPCDQAELLSLESEGEVHVNQPSKVWELSRHMCPVIIVAAVFATPVIVWKIGFRSIFPFAAKFEAASWPDCPNSPADDGQCPDWRLITCPVLGALCRAGDLVPDAHGCITEQQTFDALICVGVSNKTANETTEGNFGHLPEPKKIKIFEMDLPMALNPRDNDSREHYRSTGIRDGFAPNATAYKKFESFIGSAGKDSYWCESDIFHAIHHFKKNPNDFGTGPGTLSSIHAMFLEFRNTNNKLSLCEMRALFLESIYPLGFAARRVQAMRACHEE